MSDFSEKHGALSWKRDLPHSGKELLTGWYHQSKKELHAPLPFMSGKRPGDGSQSTADDEKDFEQYKDMTKENKRAVIWNMFIAAGNLFSDGYANSNTSLISLGLSTIYGTQYTDSNAIGNITSIVFAGTILGMILGGIWADNWGRKSGLLLANAVLIVFIILCAGAWASGTSLDPPKAGGLFAAIAAYRFFLGIGIGAEYPLGSAMSADVANSLEKSSRNKWFAWFTNCSIDWGFAVSSFVAYIVAVICGKDHINTIWRVTVGIGALVPLIFFILRLRVKEGEVFTKSRFTTKVPYLLIYKFYWYRILIVAIGWFIYDISYYGFSSFSSIILANVEGNNPSVVTTLGWNCLFNVFYLPGAVLGGNFTAAYGPRLTGGVGVIVQSVIGLAMAGTFSTLRQNMAGFTVLFGIFLSIGELSLGNNIGIMATLSFPPECRGSAYFICSVTGKVGAFAAGWIFPRVIKMAGGYSSSSGLAAPYWLASSLGMFAGFWMLFLLHPMDQASLDKEQKVFRAYLESNGFDTSTLGTLGELHSIDAVEVNDTSSFNSLSEDNTKKTQPVVSVQPLDSE